uniref:Tyrosine-protein kinase receptor Tie-1 n=1 Tax=Cacopsylla melanoneura TaxID=428564 RepID=A0A8D8QVN8_9HEMI
MKSLKTEILVFLVLTFSSTSVLGDGYDITTVYKFHAQEESDENGTTTNRYFNTCSVTVHPQTNAIGLPYVNVEQAPEIVYPLKTPSIPSLWNTGNEWKTLMSDEATEAKLDTTTMVTDDFYKVTDKDIFDAFEKNYVTTISDRWSHNYNTEIYRYPDMNDYYNNYQNIFLQVQVSKSYAGKVGIELLDRSSEKIVLQVHSTNNTIQVCPSWSECEDHVYERNSGYGISLYITLKGHLKIYDGIAKKMMFAEKSYPNRKIIDWATVSISQRSCYYGYFKLVQLYSVNVLSGDKTHISPWFQNKNNYSSLFISYARKSGRSVSIQLKEFGTGNVMQLSFEELSVINSTQSGYNEMVLAKVHVRFPENWTQMKQIQIKVDPEAYITNIWEGGDQEMYKLDDSQTCVRSDITEIYDVVLKAPKREVKVSKCFNGGKLGQDKGACECPPGFTGDACEIACGRNSYGQKCPNQCSGTGTDCKGIPCITGTKTRERIPTVVSTQYNCPMDR